MFDDEDHWMLSEEYLKIPDDKRGKVIATFPIWGPQDPDDKSEPTNHIAIFVELDDSEADLISTPGWSVAKMGYVMKKLGEFYGAALPSQEEISE